MTLIRIPNLKNVRDENPSSEETILRISNLQNVRGEILSDRIAIAVLCLNEKEALRLIIGRMCQENAAAMATFLSVIDEARAAITSFSSNATKATVMLESLRAFMT